MAQLSAALGVMLDRRPGHRQKVLLQLSCPPGVKQSSPFAEIGLRGPVHGDMGTHMKTTIEISDPLLREARALAAEQGQTLRQVVEAGLRQVVAARRKTTKAFRLRDASVGGKGLRKGLHYDDWGKILDLAYGDRG